MLGNSNWLIIKLR